MLANAQMGRKASHACQGEGGGLDRVGKGNKEKAGALASLPKTDQIRQKNCWNEMSGLYRSSRKGGRKAKNQHRNGEGQGGKEKETELTAKSHS